MELLAAFTLGVFVGALLTAVLIGSKIVDCLLWPAGEDE